MRTGVMLSRLYGAILFLFFSFSLAAQSNNCPSAITAGPDKVICPSPGSVLIGNSPVNGISYSWFPTTGLNNPNIANPLASPGSTTTYTLTATGQNLVYNGDFELGNTGFQTDYTYYIPPYFDPGHYYIGTNPASVNNNQWCNIDDHTPFGSNMLIVDGLFPYNAFQNIFWEQTISVEPNKDYLFSAWFLSTSNTLNTGGYEPIIEIKINGVIVVSDFHLVKNNCGWINLKAPVNSGTSTTALIEMRTTTDMGTGLGNDFAVDDISLSCKSTDDVTVCVCAPAPPPEIATVQIPVRHTMNFSKHNPAFGKTCLNEPGIHSHDIYTNYCDNIFLMSAYQEYDNNFPAYQSFGVDFYMTPYNYNYNTSYLDFVGHNSSLYEPCFQSDIISAQLKLFHKESPYCFKTYGWLNEYKNLAQAHNGDNAFSVQRFTQNMANACNNPQYNYDNLPAISSEIRNVAATVNPGQDYSIDITAMLKNAVVPQSNYIGFLIRQIQNSAYNNVLFNGLLGFNHNIESGEPYIELTYWRRALPISCNSNSRSIIIPQNEFLSETKLLDSISQVEISRQVINNNSLTSSISEITLYPNPASHYIKIKSFQPINYIFITSVTGQKIKEIKTKNNRPVSIDVSDLAIGVYNCTIITSQEMVNRRLVIKR